MKNILMIGVFFASISTYSQDKKHEIGLELSPISGRIVPNINYLFSINENNQLDFTGGLVFGTSLQSNFISTSFSAYYKRKFNIIEGLNWYAGPGVSFQYGRMSEPSNQFLNIGVGAQIGLEYDFSKHNIPLVFGMDISPSYHFGKGFNYFDMSPGASLRFKF